MFNYLNITVIAKYTYINVIEFAVKKKKGSFMSIGREQYFELENLPFTLYTHRQSNCYFIFFTKVISIWLPMILSKIIKISSSNPNQ